MNHLVPQREIITCQALRRVQRRLSTTILAVQRNTHFQQRLHDVHIPVAHRKVQRRRHIKPHDGFRHDVGAVRDQQLEYRRVPHLRCEMHDGGEVAGAVGVLPVHVCAVRQQQRDNIGPLEQHRRAQGGCIGVGGAAVRVDAAGEEELCV